MTRPSPISGVITLGPPIRNDPAVHVAALQVAVLSELPREPGYGKPLSALTLEGRLSRPMVRGICQDLARLGLAEHLTGLWREDGSGPAGSGYGITEAGLRLLRVAEADPDADNEAGRA